MEFRISPVLHSRREGYLCRLVDGGRKFTSFSLPLTSVRICAGVPRLMATTDSAIPAIPETVEDPGLVERARRFCSVVALAARIYAGYKATQLWTLYVSDANKAELYRRQDLRSARALYRTAISLEGMLIKA